MPAFIARFRSSFSCLPRNIKSSKKIEILPCEGSCSERSRKTNKPIQGEHWSVYPRQSHLLFSGKRASVDLKKKKRKTDLCNNSHPFFQKMCDEQ